MAKKAFPIGKCHLLHFLQWQKFFKQGIYNSKVVEKTSMHKYEIIVSIFSNLFYDIYKDYLSCQLEKWLNAGKLSAHVTEQKQFTA